MYYYISKFMQQSIKYEVDVILPENIGISIYDLNIVFGNLFDNAIENVIKSDNPRIVIDIKYIGHALYTSIANTYDGKIRDEGNVILSRKEGKHGYGLDNIRRIADKYKGNVNIQYSGEMFVVGVVMYV